MAIMNTIDSAKYPLPGDSEAFVRGLLIGDEAHFARGSDRLPIRDFALVALEAAGFDRATATKPGFWSGVAGGIEYARRARVAGFTVAEEEYMS